MTGRLEDCTLCPRMCHVNRSAGQIGYCGMNAQIHAARAALHMWEEPCISGSKGSGAVFFSGCTLRCIFCQNYDISNGFWGEPLSEKHLAEIFLRLEGEGAANINLVTAGHFAPQVAEALRLAKERGLSIPVVYNTGGYERVETLRMLEGLTDIWLPDFKYMDPELAKMYSRAANYPSWVKPAIEEMVRQAGPCVFDEDGYLRRGVVVRHLILPGHTKDSMEILQYLYGTYGDQIFISLMNQYTPMFQTVGLSPLDRKVTRREYDRVLNYALQLGITQGYFQEGATAKESFIPAFDGTGLS